VKGGGGGLRLGPEGRRAAGNLLRKAISLPIERLCGLLLVVLAGQRLGEVGFGRFQFAVTVTGLLALGTDVGLGIWSTRALARIPAADRAGAATVVATGLAVRALAVGPYVLVTAAAAWLAGPGDARGALAWLALAALAGAFVDHAAAIFRGQERFGDETRLNLLRAVAVLGLGLGGLALARSAAALAAGVAAGNLAAAFWGLAILRRHHRGGRFDRALARQALAEGFPIWLAGLLSLLYFRGDALLLRLLAGEAQLGSYSAAFRLFEGSMLVPAVLLMAVFPALARAQAEPARQRRWEARLLALLLSAGLLIGGVLFLLRGPIIGALFGSGFARAVPSLALLALAVPLLYVNYGLTHFLVARDLGRKNLLLSAAMLAVNLTANLIAIPRAGGPGAALATLITELALTAGCLLVLAKQRPRSGNPGPAPAAARTDRTSA
jgi:O-antigen/teichoic acid export membrane protein